MDKLAPSVTKFTYKKRSEGRGDPLLYKYNNEKMNTIERNLCVVNGSSPVTLPSASRGKPVPAPQREERIREKVGWRHAFEGDMYTQCNVHVCITPPPPPPHREE